MIDERKRKSVWDDDWFGFGGFEEEFEHMRMLMNRFMDEARAQNLEGSQEPFVYGFNIKQDRDGTVHMERFGNTGVEQPPVLGNSDGPGELEGSGCTPRGRQSDTGYLRGPVLWGC